MTDAIELLSKYYRAINRERDLRWAYDNYPSRKKADKHHKESLYMNWREMRDKRMDLEKTIESYIMTRTPR